MSEQRKRLTDAQFSRAREAYIADVVGDVSEDALFDDHHQAREDRKRLVKALRDRVWECECGPFQDDPEVEIYDMCLCASCVTDRALVATVDPQ